MERRIVMHYYLQLDYLISFDRYILEPHADPGYGVSARGYIEQYITVNVGELFSDDATIRELEECHLLAREAGVRFGKLLDQRPRHHLH
jgi:hypothetical protein